MKLLVEPNKEYAIKIPYDWGYVTDVYDNRVTNLHSFESRKNKIGCFQISCIEKSKGAIPQLIAKYNLINQSEGKPNLNFATAELKIDQTIAFLWMALVNDQLIKVQYICSVQTDEVEYHSELKRVRDVIETIIYIPKKEREKFFAHYHFDRFMTSIAASLDLQNRAMANESYIELIILIASQIDSQLRSLVILQKQIIYKTDELDIKLIFQNKNDRPIMEKKIYDLALKEKLITQILYDQLYSLYNERNKVVHRFIISEIKTLHIKQLAYEYANIRDQIDELVNKLEMQQFKFNIGLYKGDKSPGDSMSEKALKNLIERIKDKHSDIRINEGITMGNNM